MKYYKGKQTHLSVDDITQKVIILMNEPNECSMRVIAPAPFYDKIEGDVNNNIIEEITEEQFTIIRQEVLNRLSSL